MSAKQGRQSPEPEEVPYQVEKTADGNIDSQSGKKKDQQSSEDTKNTVLESNPKGPLEDAAAEKTSKSV